MVGQMVEQYAEITNNTFEGNTRPISVYAAMIDSTVMGTPIEQYQKD